MTGYGPDRDCIHPPDFGELPEMGAPRLLLLSGTTSIRQIILPRSCGGYGCDAVWADDFHHVVRTLVTGENEGYMGYFEGTPKQLLTFVSWIFANDQAAARLNRLGISWMTCFSESSGIA